VLDESLKALAWINSDDLLFVVLIDVGLLHLEAFFLTKVQRQPVSESLVVNGLSQFLLRESLEGQEVDCWLDTPDLASSGKSGSGHANTQGDLREARPCVIAKQLFPEKLLRALEDQVGVILDLLDVERWIWLTGALVFARGTSERIGFLDSILDQLVFGFIWDDQLGGSRLIKEERLELDQD
jgi:hypothetical protein